MSPSSEPAFEPRINVDGNIRISDLVAWERDQSIVCGVTLVSDTAPLNEEHIKKVKNMTTKTYSYLDDKQPSKWVSISTSLGDYIRMQLERTWLLQKQVNELIDSSSFRHLPHVKAENSKTMVESVGL